MGIIYCARNKVNGKLYIGKTMRSLEKRQKAHWKGRNSKHTSFGAALAKYGWDAFYWTILDNADTDEELCELEQIYIDMFSSSIKDIGYNLTHGGDGQLPNAETLEKMSLCKVGKKRPSRGRPPQEVIEKMRATLKARYASGEISVWSKGKKIIYSEETKARLSALRKGLKTTLGKRYSAEQRAKHSEALKGRKCKRKNPTVYTCVICDKPFTQMAPRGKFCPECFAKYNEDQRNKLRKDGYVPKKNPPREYRVLTCEGKVKRFIINCTTCNAPFVCGTITRKQCPACLNEEATDSCYMYVDNTATAVDQRS